MREYDIENAHYRVAARGLGPTRPSQETLRGAGQAAVSRAKREGRTMGVWVNGATVYVRPLDDPDNDFGLGPLPDGAWLAFTDKGVIRNR
jgi:hypothetical protein